MTPMTKGPYSEFGAGAFAYAHPRRQDFGEDINFVQGYWVQNASDGKAAWEAQEQKNYSPREPNI